MKKIMSIATILVMALLSVSCDKYDVSCSVPVFEGLTITPDQCYANDEVKITLNIKSPGKNAYIYESVFVIYNGSKEVSRTTLSKNEFNLNYNTYKIKAPKTPGTYTISILPRISFTAGNVIYPTNQPSEQKAKLVVLDDEEE